MSGAPNRVGTKKVFNYNEFNKKSISKVPDLIMINSVISYFLLSCFTGRLSGSQ